jgi:hydrogenase expression/formation protein HypE
VQAARLAADHPGTHAMHDPTEGGLATGLHELAYAAGTGLRLYTEQVPLLPEGARLCQEFGLDPLGAIASGALIVAVAPDEAAALQRAYAAAGIPCAHVADLVPAAEGIAQVRGGQTLPLPRYDADEITRILAS